MTDQNTSSENTSTTAPQNAEKDPSDWVTGDEPMTGPQRSYLETLARETGEEINLDITKAEASELIEKLKEESDRVS